LTLTTQTVIYQTTQFGFPKLRCTFNFNEGKQ